MSKKSKKSKAASTCLSCGQSLKKRDRHCRRCGRANLAFPRSRKAAKPYLAKGGNVTPIAAARKSRLCWCGVKATRRGATFCTSCGRPLGLTYADNVAVTNKSALTSSDPLVRQWVAEGDPELRERIWKTTHPMVTKGGGPAA